MADKCIFCKIASGEIKDEILYASENFYVAPASFGAMGPGHVLLIPKPHIRCHGAMPAAYDNEFLEMMAKTAEKLISAFSEPLEFELGVYRQTVKHAHTHFLVSNPPEYELDSLIKHAPPGTTISELNNLDDLRTIFNADGEYVSINEKKAFYAIHTKDHEGGQ